MDEAQAQAGDAGGAGRPRSNRRTARHRAARPRGSSAMLNTRRAGRRRNPAVVPSSPGTRPLLRPVERLVSNRRMGAGCDSDLLLVLEGDLQVDAVLDDLAVAYLRRGPHDLDTADVADGL